MSASTNRPSRDGRPTPALDAVGLPIQRVDATDRSPAERLGLPAPRPAPDPRQLGERAALAKHEVAKRAARRGLPPPRPRRRIRRPRRAPSGDRRRPRRTSRAARRARPTRRDRSPLRQRPETSSRASRAGSCCSRAPSRPIRRCASRSGRARRDRRSRCARPRCAAGTRTRARRRSAPRGPLQPISSQAPGASGSVMIIELFIGTSARRSPGSPAV